MSSSTPITPISQLMNGSTGTTATGGSNQLNKDTFLKLLVAQLKYQDPSKPVDSSQFMAQSAQFTMVEKLDQIATQATDTLAAQWATAGATYLGRYVQGVASDSSPVKGIVTGVRFESGGPVLQIGDPKSGGKELPVANVQLVTVATDGQTSPSPSSTSSTTSDPSGNSASTSTTSA